MDNERFARALEAAASRQRGGIGTLGEKGVHNTLKNYYEPDSSCHEIPVGGYVADIVGENGIIEIQTGSFSHMREKLKCFLEAANVTIVWPCVVNKRIIRVDRETGETVSCRRSNVHLGEYDIFMELRSIREFLADRRLKICIAQLEADEYRPANESRSRRRRGAYNGIERYPTALVGEVWLQSPEDYTRFLPEGLPERFTVRDMAALCGLRREIAGSVLYVLRELGTVKLCGTEKRAYVYQRSYPESSASALQNVDAVCVPEKAGDTASVIKTDEDGRIPPEIDISVLRQPLDGLDGQMCVAMAAGVPVGEVIRRTGCGRWQMNGVRLLNALSLFDVPHADKLTRVGSRGAVLPRYCIISEHGHFLLHMNGIFYDNVCGCLYSYDTKNMTGFVELYSFK